MHSLPDAWKAICSLFLNPTAPSTARPDTGSQVSSRASPSVSHGFMLGPGCRYRTEVYAYRVMGLWKTHLGRPHAEPQGAFQVHFRRGLTTSLRHRAGWNPELCDKSSRNNKGVHALGWRTSATENQSQYLSSMSQAGMGLLSSTVEGQRLPWTIYTQMTVAGFQYHRTYRKQPGGWV